MKHISFLIITVVIMGTGFSGCKNKKPAPSGDLIGKDASYALGMNFGSTLKEGNITPEWDEFLQGMKDIVYGNELRFTMEKAGQVFYEAYNANIEKRSEAARQEGIDFLAKNKQKTGVITTESGLQYEVINQGSGPKPEATDIVRVNYKGTLLDGTEFDSSYSRGQPIEFPLNGVIRGWSEGVQLMNTGSKYRFFIPSELGYGSDGMGSNIPPNSTLIFEVELLDIIKIDKE